MIIVGVVAVLLFVTLLYLKKIEWIINFLLRAVLGIILVYCCNSILHKIGVTNLPGINTVNIASIGILGIPGIILLYGITFYFSL